MVWIIVVVLVIICLVLVFRLKQQQERVSALYKSDKLKSHFIKSLAYEIRSPLQSVMKEACGRPDQLSLQSDGDAARRGGDLCRQ